MLEGGEPKEPDHIRGRMLGCTLSETTRGMRSEKGTRRRTEAGCHQLTAEPTRTRRDTIELGLEREIGDRESQEAHRLVF